MRASTHGRARASSSTGRITSITAGGRLGTTLPRSHYDSLNTSGAPLPITSDGRTLAWCSCSSPEGPASSARTSPTPCAPAATTSACSTRGPEGTSATPTPSSARSPASTHVCHQAGDGRAGRRLRRRGRLRLAQRPRHRGAAARARAPALPRAARARVEHGRLRRGPLPVRRRTVRVRPGHAVAADLDAGRFEPRCPRCGATSTPRRSARTRRPTRATCTRRPSSTRSTSPSRSPARPGCRSPRCATTTSTGRGCRATPRTPASPRSSPTPWPRAARLASSRTAASCATSSTCATSREPTCWRCRRREPAPGAFNVCSGDAAQCRRDGARPARRARRRGAARRGHRRVPARRRPPRVRLSGARRRRAGLHRAGGLRRRDGRARR